MSNKLRIFLDQSIFYGCLVEMKNKMKAKTVLEG